MLEALSVFHPNDIIAGFVGVTAWFPLTLMILGVLVASFFAAAPGIGGLLLLSLLMPYAMTLDPFAFIALIFGAATVGNTANTFTSVLIGVPGGSGSQATILDGYPLAKKGQANRALGAAFFGSLVGAIIGAIAFIISLPFFKPLVLSLGSPEFLMMVLLGLSAVAILGGKQPVKGLVSATVGMSIALDRYRRAYRHRAFHLRYELPVGRRLAHHHRHGHVRRAGDGGYFSPPNQHRGNGAAEGRSAGRRQGRHPQLVAGDPQQHRRRLGGRAAGPRQFGG